MAKEEVGSTVYWVVIELRVLEDWMWGSLCIYYWLLQPISHRALGVIDSTFKSGHSSTQNFLIHPYYSYTETQIPNRGP